MERRRSWALVVWCVGLVAGTVFFHGLGAEELAPPPLEPAGWSTWLAERVPEVAVIAVLRLVVLGLCWYLVGVTTIGLVARLLRAARLIRVADALTVPWLRRLLQQGLGVALATAMVTSAAGAAPAGVGRPLAAPEPATDGGVGEQGRAGGDGGVDEQGPTGGDGGGLDVLPLPVPFGREGDVPGTAAGPAPPLVVAEPPLAADEPVAGAPTSYVVRSGDSLWRIAEQQLAHVLDRAPDDAEIVPYWRELIERNRDGLPDPDDPDLILPGQRLELPALPEA